MEEKTAVCSESLSLERWHGQSMYTRTKHQALWDLQSALTSSYRGWSSIASSGMAAFSTVLHNILIQCPRDVAVNVIHGNELYEDTPELIRYLQKSYRFSFNIHSVDVTDTQSIVDLFRSDGVQRAVNILVIEACSNPSGYIFDFAIIPTLQSLSSHLYVVVDNTWLSSVIFNPFDHCRSVKSDQKEIDGDDS